MDLKQEFLATLEKGADHAQLLKVVDRFRSAGMSSQTAYDILERIWLESGFDDSDEPSERRDNLESVMEKVWYECPATGRG
jgi:hypothetical protein